MVRRWLLATSLVVLVAARSMPAQGPLAFDMASLRPSPYPNAREDLFTPPDGSVLITNYTLGGLITYAYDLKTRHELAGGPEWLLEEKFVVNAAAPQGTTDAQIRLMVQDLLAERFKLQLQKEEGALPVWTLTLDRADGSLGPRLTPSPYDCTPFFADRSTTSPDAPRDQEGQPACKIIWSGVNNGTTLTMTGATIDEFVNRIDPERFTGLDRPIVNGTGLNGTWDMQVSFASPVRRLNIIPQTGPPIDLAVKEQLGLRLELRTAPGMRYVVESVERPIID